MTDLDLFNVFMRLTESTRSYNWIKSPSTYDVMRKVLREDGLLDEKNELTEKAKLALITTRLKS